ncbi:MAG TPA: PLP-dependent aminotransferase family protein [Micromonosporaceae bacterium]
MGGTIRGVQLARLLGAWRGRGPEYAALAASVRGLLTDGRLALGVRLPAERELAEALGISRTTVSAAYRVLRESGHLVSRRGAGSWTALPANRRVATSGVWTPAGVPELDLSCAALPAPPVLADAAAEAVAELPRYLSTAGYHPTGLPALREAVAAMFRDRGLPTSPDQIMITNGVQHALDLTLRLLAPPGHSVLVEVPTYPNALVGISAGRRRVVPHGLTDDGWDDDLLLTALRQTRPRLAYLIPEFHNPTGHLMPLGLREALPGAAHAAGTDLVIDETFVDLPLDGQPVPPPVACFDRHARVFTVGGMSKPFWGGLRIGWIRTAAPLVQRLAAVRVGVDMAGPVLDQLVAVRMLARAAEVVAHRRAELRARRDTLVAAVRRELPEWRVRVPTGGVSLWAELDAPVSSALARTAERRGVRIAPGPRFGLDGTMERFLRLPYTLPEADLVDAVSRLAAARADLDEGARPTWSEPALVA